MEKIFQATSLLLAAALILSAVGHLVLLSSDSPEYRLWVAIQIALQIVGAGPALAARRFKPMALIGLLLVAIPFVYINAVFVNYGNIAAQLSAAVLIAAAYSGLVISLRHRFWNLS
jgi:hypothetical protein